MRALYLHGGRRKAGLNLCRRGVILEQLRWAIWLGCARRHMAMLNGENRLPITRIAYFASLIKEVSQSPESHIPPATGTTYCAEWRKWKGAGSQPDSLAGYGHRPRRTITARNAMSALDRATSIFGWLTSVEIAAISVGTCPTYLGMVPHCGRDAPQQKRDDGNEMMLLDPTRNLDSSGALRNSGNQGRFDLTLPMISGSVLNFNGVRNGGAVSEKLFPS